MSNVSRLRPFKFPQHKIVDSDFIPSRLSDNEEFMAADLALSGLTADDVGAWTHGHLAVPSGFRGGYVIGYTAPDGSWVTDDENVLQMWRTKLEASPGFYANRKYDQPTGEELRQAEIFGQPPYIPPQYHKQDRTETLAICEGEKKAAAFMKYIGMDAIGLGGCWCWRNGSDGIHDWILQIVRQYKHVIVIPDGDFRRYDISKAYGTFCAELLATPGFENLNLEICDLPKTEKIDDLLVKWGPDAQAGYESLGRVSPDDLVETPTSLARTYQLAFKQDSNGNIKVPENTRTIQQLIDKHPAFPKPWLNLDTMGIHIGDRPASDDLFMEIAHHFQYNFEMHTVKIRDVEQVIKGIAVRDGRSPFKDFVESQVWDGVPRLDTWMHRLWGVEDNPYHREVSSKFLIASVARQQEPGAKVDWMMITTGGQGTGKSSMPDILWPDLTAYVIGNPGGKDIFMLINRGLCVIIDELDALNKKNQDFWKSAITTRVDSYRPPYGRETIQVRRTSILYGTTNDSTFLADDHSGHRRYCPVTVEQLLDFEGLGAEMPQLWAEAYLRWSNGESWHVEHTAEKQAMLQKHVEINTDEEAIDEFLTDLLLEPPKGVVQVVDGKAAYGTRKGGERLCVTYRGILGTAGINPNGSHHKKKIQTYLQSLGGRYVHNATPVMNGRCWEFDVPDLRVALGLDE